MMGDRTLIGINYNVKLINVFSNNYSSWCSDENLQMPQMSLKDIISKSSMAPDYRSNHINELPQEQNNCEQEQHLTLYSL